MQSFQRFGKRFIRIYLIKDYMHRRIKSYKIHILVCSFYHTYKAKDLRALTKLGGSNLGFYITMLQWKKYQNKLVATQDDHGDICADMENIGHLIVQHFHIFQLRQVEMPLFGMSLCKVIEYQDSKDKSFANHIKQMRKR